VLRVRFTKVFKYQNEKGYEVDFIMAFQKKFRISKLRTVGQTDTSVVYTKTCTLLMALLAI